MTNDNKSLDPEDFLETPDYLMAKIREQVDKLVEVSGEENTKDFLKTIKL